MQNQFVESPLVANILPDREIRALLGTAIINGSPDCVRSTVTTSLAQAKFDSTGKNSRIPDGISSKLNLAISSL